MTSYLPRRVTLQENGTYLWSSVVDRDFEREANKMALRICVVMEVLVLLLGAGLSIHYRSLSSFGIVAGCIAASMLITAGVIHGLNSMPGEVRNTYLLTDTFIRSGSGRHAFYYDFKRTRTVIITPWYIEMKSKFNGFRVYVPEEDMPFVRDYIMMRMPVGIEIRYESMEEMYSIPSDTEVMERSESSRYERK